MKEQPGKTSTSNDSAAARRQSPTGGGRGLSEQRGGDLAPDPAHKATEDAGRAVNANRPDKPK